MMVFFVVNFMGNIKRYRLLRWEKWPLLLLHLSWILIIVGAAITYFHQQKTEEAQKEVVDTYIEKIIAVHFQICK